MRTVNLFLLAIWGLVSRLCSAQINSVTDSGLVDDSCTFEEIIERKRQAVKVRLSLFFLNKNTDKRLATLTLL